MWKNINNLCFFTKICQKNSWAVDKTNYNCCDCSIPSLIWAASAMPDSGADKSPSMRFLEDRVYKLETELAEKDGETSRLLRAMEQQCQQSKVHWLIKCLYN